MALGFCVWGDSWFCVDGMVSAIEHSSKIPGGPVVLMLSGTVFCGTGAERWCSREYTNLKEKWHSVSMFSVLDYLGPIFKNFILFLVVLSLHCCVQAFLCLR